jgi:hypothetical protein
MAAWNTPLTTRLSTLLVAFLLTVGGCASDDEESSSFLKRVASQLPAPPSSAISPETEYETRVTGSVGDGPIIGARLRVFANSGALIMESTSDSTADYDLTVKTQGKNYAISIRADQGTDLVTGMAPDFALLTALTRPTKRAVSNLNPFSTLIFSTASHNGGINDTTVAEARQAMMSRYGFGLDAEIFPDPVGTEVTDANVSLIVKSSETLGEMIRRTRDALMATGANLDGDGIIRALAADLVDGWIDGYGAASSSSRIAAVANVASAAVLLEAMSNQLRVYDFDATEAMDLSISQIRPSAPATSSTTNVPISAAALEQAGNALRAAQLFNDDPRIADAIALVAATTPGTLPADFAPQLPDGVHGVLRETTLDAAYASDDEIDAINLAARTASSEPAPEPEPEPAPEPDPEPSPEPDPEPTPEPDPEPTPAPNNPPVISGAPASTTLEVGTAWSFTPTASDPDGDALTFSISGKPGWMSFDSNTGQLSGTPTSAHVGSYPDIVISVSDGQDNASLAAFSLTVAEPPAPAVLGNATVSWTPPTERTDGTPLTDLAGYKIYYGKSSSALDMLITVADPAKTSHVVEGLDTGTWYFAVTAYDAAGFESAKSSLASKTFP